MNELRCEDEYTQVDVSELWLDIKRILAVQMKELIHTIEDAELTERRNGRPPFKHNDRNVA